MTENKITKIEGIKSINHIFEAYIVDIWGVLWDGIEPYTDAKKTLQSLKKLNKPILLLSNAPRRAKVVKDKLKSIGIHEELYNKIISSGEICRNNFLTNKSVISKVGSSFYFIGQDTDKCITEELPLTEVGKIKDADFLLVCGTRNFNDGINIYKKELDLALKFNLPFVCVNPDKYVIRKEGKLLICAGIMAEYYQSNKGIVFSFGKPFSKAYEECIKYLKTLKPHIKKKQILIVGDSLETDILGANNCDMASLLIANGIHRDDLLFNQNYLSSKKIIKLFSRYNACPSYITKDFTF